MATETTNGPTGTSSPVGEDELGETIYRVLARTCETNDLALATAVAVSDLLVVTVAHTLEQAASVEVEDGRGNRLPVEVAWLDAERDIALLQLPTASARWLTLGSAVEGDAASIVTIAEGEPDPGDAGFAIETVMTEILRNVNITVEGAGARAGFELRGDIDLGDSGSPVLSPDGQLVGMVFGANRSEPRGWAVAAKEIEAALAQQEGGPVVLDC